MFFLTAEFPFVEKGRRELHQPATSYDHLYLLDETALINIFIDELLEAVESCSAEKLTRV